jgi:predicted membrane metal-binding protein
VDHVKVSVDPASLRALLDKSSQFDKTQKAALRKRLREAGQDARAAVQAAARQPGVSKSPHPRHTGLRARIASGTRVSVLAGRRAGVQVVTRAQLSQAWEARRGWRHPVLGNRDTWVRQVGHPGYFSATIFARRRRVRQSIEQAMREAIRSMEGSP